MRTRLTAIAAAVLLAATPALAGCGNDDDQYAHCYDAVGNYDDDIDGCPDLDSHPKIPAHRTPKTSGKKTTTKSGGSKKSAPRARTGGHR